jgi:predicted Zn-dependent protease
MVGQSLVKQVGRPELSYFFAVLDLDEPNAYATPGGFVFVTRGLLSLLQDESELAAVLAHEIVHINHKHMYLKVAPKREVGAGETLTRILSRGAGDIGSSLSQAVGEGLKTLLESGLTHDNEHDSDTTAVVYAATVGYNPTSLVAVLERLKAHKGPSVFEKTHPSFDARIARIRATLKENALQNAMKAKADVLQRRFAVAMKGLPR